MMTRKAKTTKPALKGTQVPRSVFPGASPLSNRKATVTRRLKRMKVSLALAERVQR